MNPYIKVQKIDNAYVPSVAFSDTPHYDSSKMTTEINEELLFLEGKYKNDPRNEKYIKRLRALHKKLTGKAIYRSRGSNYNRMKNKMKFICVKFQAQFDEGGKLETDDFTFNFGINTLRLKDGSITDSELAGLIKLYLEKGAQVRELIVGNRLASNGPGARYGRLVNINIQSRNNVNTDANLLDIAMKKMDTKLIAGLEHLAQINQHPGQCVIDYITYQLSSSTKNSKKRSLKEENFVKYFGHDYKTTGVTINGLKDFCTAFGINLYAFSDFGSLVCKVHFSNVSHNALMFHIKNQHLYPILDPSLRKSVPKTDFSPMMSSYKLEVNYDKTYYIGPKVSEKQFILMIRDIASKQDPESFYFLVDDQTHDISNILSEVQLHSKYLITDIEFDLTNRVKAFKVPGKPIIVEKTRDFEQRRSDYEFLRKQLPQFFTTFENRSYAAMGSQIFEIFQSKKALRSHMNKQVFQLFDEYRQGPLVACLPESKQVLSDYYLRGFDICKSYTNYLLNGNARFCQFMEFDEPQPYDQSDITHGFYFLSKGVSSTKYSLSLPPGLFFHDFVSWALKHEFIQSSDITIVIKPKYTISGKLFQNFVTLALTLDSAQDKVMPKKLINHFVGTLGTRCRNIVKGTIVDNYMEACALFNHAQQQDHNPCIYDANGIYFVNSVEEVPLFRNTIPVFQQIIQAGIMQIVQVAIDLAAKDSIVYSYNTDYVCIAKPREIAESEFQAYSINTSLQNKITDLSDRQFEFLQPLFERLRKPQIDDIGRVRPDSIVIRGQDICSYEPEFPPITQRDFKQIPEGSLEENIAFAASNSCLFNGLPGSGKSYLIAQFSSKYPEQTIVFCSTNIACDNLRKQGVSNIYTFDSYFHLNTENRKLGSTIKYIIVDEISMVNSSHLSHVLFLKDRNPDIKVLLFGDFNQCKPVEDTYYNYYGNQTFRDLVDFNEMKIHYKPETARFDAITNEYLQQLLDKGTLPYQPGQFYEHMDMIELAESSTIDLSRRIHVTRTNSTKHYINQLLVSQVYKEDFNGITTQTGCLYSCIVNNKKHQIFNGQTFEVVAFNKPNLILQQMHTDRLITYDLEQDFQLFQQHFEYGFARTIYKIQGITIREKFQIHDCSIMDLNELYTSISRCVTIKDVLILDCDLSRTYTSHYTIQKKKRAINRFDEAVSPDLNQEAFSKIYKIILPPNAESDRNVYIGKTNRSLRQRMKEHKDQRHFLSDKFHVFLKGLSDSHIAALTIIQLQQVRSDQEQEVLDAEKFWIQKHIDDEWNVFNTQHGKSKKKDIRTQPEIILPQKKVRRPHITNTKQCVIVNYPEGEVMRRKFYRFGGGRSMTFEHAKELADAFVASLYQSIS